MVRTGLQDFMMNKIKNGQQKKSCLSLNLKNLVLTEYLNPEQDYRIL